MLTPPPPYAIRYKFRRPNLTLLNGVEIETDTTQASSIFISSIMAECFKFSFLVVAILFSAFFVSDSEGVFGILTPKEGKRGFENESPNRKTTTLQAMRQKLQRNEAFNAMISKLVRIHYFHIYTKIFIF